MKKKPLSEQPITKFELAILVGNTLVFLTSLIFFFCKLPLSTADVTLALATLFSYPTKLHLGSSPDFCLCLLGEGERGLKVPHCVDFHQGKARQHILYFPSSCSSTFQQTFPSGSASKKQGTLCSSIRLEG